MNRNQHPFPFGLRGKSRSETIPSVTSLISLMVSASGRLTPVTYRQTLTLCLPMATANSTSDMPLFFRNAFSLMRPIDNHMVNYVKHKNNHMEPLRLFFNWLIIC